MKRRSIFQALAGIIGAKSLPAATVKVPASLQVAKAAARVNPLFNATQYIMAAGKDGKMGLFCYDPTLPDDKVTLNRVA